MAFNVKAKRREGGGYDLHYGKGSKKLQGLCLPSTPPQPANKFQAEISGVLHCGSFAQIKEMWGAWAMSVYTGESGTDEAEPDSLGGEESGIVADAQEAKLNERQEAAEEPTHDRYRVHVSGYKAGPPAQCQSNALVREGNRIVHKFTLSNGAAITVSMSKAAALDLAQRIDGMV